MVDNPIKYSDLFSSDVLTGIQSIKAALEDLVNIDKSKLADIGKALRSVTPDTSGGQDQIVKYSQEIEGLKKRIGELEEQLKSLSATEGRIRQVQESNLRARIEQREAIREQTKEIKDLIAQEKISEEELQRLSQAGNLQKMSYNQLSAVYSTLKDRVNAMTAATEEELAAREKWSGVAKQVYLQMIQLQEATGKHTLSVGNYAKAFNGLNLATQQIVREIPTMTMGARMFFMAISNNLPILTDQIAIYNRQHKQSLQRIADLQAERAQMIANGATSAALAENQKAIQAAQAGAVPVGQALLKSLLSWQTAMIIGITILTQYGDKIWAWIKSLFSSKEAIEDNTAALEEFRKGLSDIEGSVAAATTELKVLYEVATDNNVAMDTRLKAVKALQATFPQTFKDLSDEEIMAGRVKSAYDELTKSLERNAKARAAMTQVEGVYKKIIDAQTRMIAASEKASAAGVDDLSQAMEKVEDDAKEWLTWGWVRRAPVAGPYKSMLDAVGISSGAARDAAKEYAEAEKDLNGYNKELELYVKLIKDQGLIADAETTTTSSSGRRGREVKELDDIEAVLENLKYIRKAREEEIGNISDDTARELAMAEYKYATQLEDFRDFQRKQKEIQLEIAALTEQRDKEVTIEKRNELTKQINDLKKKWKIDEEGQVAVDNYLIQLEKAFQAERAEILFNAQKAQADYNNKALDEELTLRKLIVENTVENEEERKKAIILATIDIEEQRLQMMLQYEGVYSATQIAIVRETIEKLKREWGKVDEVKGEGKKSFLERLFGDSKTTRRFFNDLRRVLKMTADNIKEIINLYKEQAEAAAKAAEEQVKAAEKVYDAELAAYENGYANNVEFARRELDLRKQQHQATLAEAERYQKMQEAVDSATQVSSMITAVANLLANWSAIPYIGQALAVAAIAAMFATFAAAKITAASMVKPVTYGEGMSEYLDYGGSHASGNDIDFGHTKDGRPRRVERGEMIAVFNKRNVDRYGANTLAGLVDAVNRGTLEREISGSFAGADGEFSINVTKYDDKYIRDISRDLHAIRQGDGRTVTPMPDGSLLVRQGNHTRRIRR